MASPRGLFGTTFDVVPREGRSPRESTRARPHPSLLPHHQDRRRRPQRSPALTRAAAVPGRLTTVLGDPRAAPTVRLGTPAAPSSPGGSAPLPPDQGASPPRLRRGRLRLTPGPPGRTSCTASRLGFLPASVHHPAQNHAQRGGSLLVSEPGSVLASAGVESPAPAGAVRPRARRSRGWAPPEARARRPGSLRTPSSMVKVEPPLSLIASATSRSAPREPCPLAEVRLGEPATLPGRDQPCPLAAASPLLRFRHGYLLPWPILPIRGDAG